MFIKEFFLYKLLFILILNGILKIFSFAISCCSNSSVYENFNLFSGNNIELLELLLPLAISFFTFQQIAYLVDSYRNETKEYNFLDYALFVTFFPQLISGPIVNHKEMMPQFLNNTNMIINYKNIAMGLFIFSIGLSSCFTILRMRGMFS